MNATHLRGMAIVSVAEAELFGRVEDVLFQTEPLRARAVRVARGKKRRLVALSDLGTVGRDAIVAADRSSVTASEARLADERLEGLAGLARRKVVDEQGTLIGEVSGLDFEPSTGEVTSIVVVRRGPFGIGHETTTFGPQSVLSIGDELITVHIGGGTAEGTAAPVEH